MGRRGFIPDYVWIIRYNGLSPDRDAEPITIVRTTKFAAVTVMLPMIVNALKAKYPRADWIEDITDQNKKTSFYMGATENDKIFVEVQRHWLNGNDIPFVLSKEKEEENNGNNLPF